jgi:hypothetical protein
VPLSPLAARWFSLAGALRWEYDEMFPPEPLLKVGSGFRLKVKRRVWRYTRPVSRRYDRIAGDLAELGFETAQALGEEHAADVPGPAADAALTIRDRITRLERQVEMLESELRAARGGSEPDGR